MENVDGGLLTFLAPVPFNPLDFKPKYSPRIPKENWSDEWRVGLLSPDPSNPRPVFSPPTKPRDEPKKESNVLPVSVPEVKEVECAPAVKEQERAEDADTDTELEEEEQVFEMTSIDIRVMLPGDEADQYVQHPPA